MALSARQQTAGAFLAVVVSCAAAAFGLSYLVGAPRGAQHSCPSMPGASRAAMIEACTYPPDELRWALEWGAGGLVLGVLAGIAVIGWFGPFDRSRPSPRSRRRR